MGDYSAGSLSGTFGGSASRFSRTETGLIIDNEFPRNRTVQNFKEATARNGFPLRDQWGLDKQIQYFLDSTREQIPIIAMIANIQVGCGEHYEAGYMSYRQSNGLLCLTQNYIIYSSINSLRFGSISDDFKTHEISNHTELTYEEVHPSHLSVGRLISVQGNPHDLFKFALKSGRLNYVAAPPPAPPRPPL